MSDCCSTYYKIFKRDTRLRTKWMVQHLKAGFTFHFPVSNQGRSPGFLLSSSLTTVGGAGWVLCSKTLKKSHIFRTFVINAASKFASQSSFDSTPYILVYSLWVGWVVSWCLPSSLNFHYIKITAASFTFLLFLRHLASLSPFFPSHFWTERPECIERFPLHKISIRELVDCAAQLQEWWSCFFFFGLCLVYFQTLPPVPPWLIFFPFFLSPPLAFLPFTSSCLLVECQTLSFFFYMFINILVNKWLRVPTSTRQETHFMAVGQMYFYSCQCYNVPGGVASTERGLQLTSGSIFVSISFFCYDSNDKKKYLRDHSKLDDQTTV